MVYAKLDGYFTTEMGNFQHEYIRTDDKQIDEKYNTNKDKSNEEDNIDE